MENIGKGTEDARNSNRNCRYDCNDYQYYRNSHQYRADQTEKQASKKQPHRPKLGCFFH